MLNLTNLDARTRALMVSEVLLDQRMNRLYVRGYPESFLGV